MSAAPKHVREIADPRERLIARFLCKVDKQPDDGCWLWTAAKDEEGYGSFQYQGKKERAHRFAAALFVDGYQDDLNVCHTCDNPACVKPKHLFMGTTVDNVADRVCKGRSSRGDTHGRKTRPEAFVKAIEAKRHVFAFRGQSLTLHQIAAITGVKLVTLRGRMDRGWDIERAVAEPTHNRGQGEFAGTSVAVVILRAVRVS